MVALGGGAVSSERGTPVHLTLPHHSRLAPLGPTARVSFSTILTKLSEMVVRERSMRAVVSSIPVIESCAPPPSQLLRADGCRRVREKMCVSE